MKQPLGVILAGGEGRRMGGADKALMPLAGRPLLEHVVDRLEPQVARLAISANGDPARFAGWDMRILPDEDDDRRGPLAGILAGLDWAAEQGADTIVTVACDTPFFPADLVPHLLLVAEPMEAPMAIAVTPNEAGMLRRHPTFGLWPVALRHDLRSQLASGLRQVSLWADAHFAREAQFPSGRPDPFFNLNTREDLAQAEQHLGAA